MGRHSNSTSGKRKIVIGIITSGMMNKRIVRHFKDCESTISSFRTKICQMGSVENDDRSRKTIRGEEIDKVTSSRRNRFLGRAIIPGLVRSARGTRICAKTVQTTEGRASALMSPIRWCAVNCLHKRVRLNWTTTHCRCILDDIGLKLFSRKSSELA